MKINRCMNCMNETETYPCPHCGYDGSDMPKLEYALKPGTILGGKYLIGQVLGRGGFGITYIGFDLALERKVAVKEFFPAIAASRSGGTTTMLSWHMDEQTQKLRQAGLQSVLAEARKMAKLEDVPRVVKVRDALEENNTAYIVMDYVEGETLKKRLKRAGAMSWDEARTLFLPVLDAMGQVHAAGLIHRDISPDNLMLTPDGKLRILDLGAAKDVSASGGGKSEEVVKNGFSPFEQYTQRGSAGPWSDVYAMAATILYTLTGQVPPSALDRMADDTLNFGAPEYQNIPVGVRQALCHAMAVQRENRTQSMSELKKELEQGMGPRATGTNSVNGGQTFARGTGTHTAGGAQDAKKSKKTLWAVLGAAAVLVVLLVVILANSGKDPNSNPVVSGGSDTTTNAQVSATTGTVTQSGDGISVPALTYTAPTPVVVDTSATVEEQEIFNESGIVVTVTGLEYNSFKALLTLTVENGSGQDVKVKETGSSIAVNGYSLFDWIYENISSGDAVDITLDCYTDDLSELGISQITDITFALTFEDSDYNAVAETGYVTVHTSAYGSYTQTYDESGITLEDTSDIKVIYQGMVLPEELTDDEAIELYFLIENSSDDTIIVEGNDTSVDDNAVSDYLYETVLPGTYCIASLEIDSENLEDCGISSAGEIEITFFFTNLEEDYADMGESQSCIISTGKDAVQNPPSLASSTYIYDENDVRIGYLGYFEAEDEYDDPEIRLLVENNGTDDISMWNVVTTMDGVEATNLALNTAIPAGKSGIVYVSFFYLEKDGINISEVDTISLDMEIDFGDTDKTVPTYEISLSGDSASAAAQTTASDTGFSLGEISGSTYRNEYLGIACTLDSDWFYWTDAELAEGNNISESQQSEAYLEEATLEDYFTLMQAENDTSAMWVDFRRFPSRTDEFTQDYLDALNETAIQSVLEDYFEQDSDYTNTSGKTFSMTFKGKKCVVGKITGEIEGVDFYFVELYFAAGDGLATIDVICYGEDNTEELLGRFYTP